MVWTSATEETEVHDVHYISMGNKSQGRISGL